MHSKIQEILSECKLRHVTSVAMVEGDRVGELKPLLTLTSTGKNPYTLELYKTSPNDRFLFVPRALVRDRIRNLTYDGNALYESDIDLRPEQDRLIRDFCMGIKGYPSGGIIKSPTGSGKTFMGIYYMAMKHYRTLIVVPTDRIMSQWYSRLKALSNLKEEQIGIIREDKMVVNGRWACIGMIHTLAKRHEYISRRLYNEFDLIIYDEIHKLGARTFSRTATMFNSHVKLGLSATPRRKDGMDNVFLWHIGPVLAEYKTQTDYPRVIMVDYYNPRSSQAGCVWAGELILPRYLNKLCEIRERTEKIAKYALAAHRKGHRVLVLSDRISILKQMRRIMAESIPEQDIGLIIASTKQVDKPMILGTYGSAGLGLDIPELSCLVFATPRVDIEQPVGRILREHKGKRDPVVVDFVDSASPIMVKWSMARERYYKHNAEEIVRRRERYGS